MNIKNLSQIVTSHPYKTLVVVVVAVILFTVLFGNRSQSPNRELATAPVKRSDLVVTISATGVVEPEEVVDVGAQIAGQIKTFGKDMNGKSIDYGSEVEEGMVLAEIDDSLYTADVAQGEANLKRAQANAVQARAKLKLAEADWNRRKGLKDTPAIAQAELDSYAANFEVAQSNVSLSDAEIAVAQSNLQRAQRNLGYCTIRSPVRGVIVDRRVNIGQTVVASLNAPSLFLIAKDLKNVAVWAAVNEADIANITIGQKVTFSVDAYPSEKFQGAVRRIRLNASMNQNVVTYIVEVSADNSTGKLLPYLTANVEFEVTRRTSVLVVPNVALRYTPAPEPGAGGGRARPAQPTKREPGTGTVWVKQGRGAPQEIEVKIGGSDGRMTEVIDGIEEGTEVVTGIEIEQDTKEDIVNPFAPKMSRGGRRS